MVKESMNLEIAHVENRKLSYRRLGQGKRKILFFHGFPGSSLQVEAFREYAGPFDLEVVCIDRPGYAQSIRDEEQRQFSQSTKITMGFLQSLGWTSCEVVSVSGGTPFLFSFLQTFPEFISKVSVVSGLAPLAMKDFRGLIRWQANLALRAFPFIPSMLIEKAVPAKGATRDGAGPSLIRYLLPASSADVRAVQESDAQKLLAQSLMEAFAQKGLGPQKDAEEYLTPWSLDLKSYQGPIDIWHGTDDQILPVEMARRLAKNIPQSKLHLLEGEGHFSVAMKYIHKVLA